MEQKLIVIFFSCMLGLAFIAGFFLGLLAASKEIKDFYKDNDIVKRIQDSIDENIKI